MTFIRNKTTHYKPNHAEKPPLRGQEFVMLKNFMVRSPSLPLSAQRSPDKSTRTAWHTGVFLLGLLLAALAQADSPRLDKIRSSGVLRVCIWPEYYGITYRHPITQQLSGIDIDMAYALARDLGVKPVFVDSNFARVINDVSEDRCDIAMFAIGILPYRAERLNFSQPYLRSDIYAITTRSNRRIKSWQDIDKPGVVVAVSKGTLHETIMREKLKHATLQVLAAPHTREQEVESGRADVFMTDYPYSRRMLETTDWARLISPPTPYHLTPYAYAVRKGEKAWHARIERFVADIKKDGRLRQAARRNKLQPALIDSR